MHAIFIITFICCIDIHDSEENYTFIQQSQKQKMHAVPDHSTVYIEYCRACDTHSWCTHHDEGKYLSYFHKLATMITNEFPDINVVGNKIPAHLIPLTGYDNKFYNSKTKKYINFPAIGAFEVVFGGQTIFSKKKTNAWPELFDIKKQIKSVLINGQEETIKNGGQSNNKSLQASEEEENNNDEMATDKQTITFATNQYMDNDDVRTTFYKPKQSKMFTLTDHFKIYKMQKKQNERGSKDIDCLEKPLSKVEVRSKKWEEITLKNPLSNFLKERAYINQEKGKREMIIDLHSIEEEVFAEENCVSKRQRGLTRNNLENREVMKQWDQQLNFLEHKFRKVESSLSKIKEKNKQFDSSIELEWLNRINQNKQHKQNEQNKEHVRMPCLRHSSHSPRDQPKSQKDSVPNYLPAKLVKIDKYINSSQAYKNKKLHEIYGEWKIIKRNLNPVEPRYLSKRKQYTLESQSDDDGNNGRKKRKTQRKQRSNGRDEKQSYRFDSQHDTQFPNIDNKNKKFTQTMRQPYKLGGALESINAEKLTGKSGRQTPSHDKISNDRKITNKSPNWNTDAVRFVDRNYQIKMKSPEAKQDDDIESIKTSTKQNRFFTTERCNRSYKQNEKNKQNSKEKLKKPLNHLYKKIGERNKMMQIQIENGKDEQSGKQKKQSEAVSIRTQKKNKMNVLKQKVKQEMGNSKQDQMRKERIKKIKELKQQKRNPDDIYKLKYRGSLENQQPEQKQEDKQIDNFFKGQFSDEEELSQQGQKDDCELIQERSDENQAKQQQPEVLKHDKLICQKQEGKNEEKKQIGKGKTRQKQVMRQQKETKNRKMVKRNEQSLIKQKDRKIQKQNNNKVKNNQDKSSTGNKMEQKEDEKPQKNQLKIEKLNQLGTNKKVDKENSEKRKKGQNQILKNLVSKNSKVHSEPLDSKSQRSQNHAINKLKGIKKDRISGDTANNDKEQTKQFEDKINGQGKNDRQQHLQQQQKVGKKLQELDEENKEKEQQIDNNFKEDISQKLIQLKQNKEQTEIKNKQNSTKKLNHESQDENFNQLQRKDEQNEKCQHDRISDTGQYKAKNVSVQLQKNNKQKQQSNQLKINTEDDKESNDQNFIKEEKHEKLDQTLEANKQLQKDSQQIKLNQQSKLQSLQEKQKLERIGDDQIVDKKKQQNIRKQPQEIKTSQEREDKDISQVVTKEKDIKDIGQVVTTKEQDEKEEKMKIVQHCENFNKQPFKQIHSEEKKQYNQQRQGERISSDQQELKKGLQNCKQQERPYIQQDENNKLVNDIADSQKEQPILNREEENSEDQDQNQNENKEKIQNQPLLSDKDQIVANPKENQKPIKERQLTNQISKFEERDQNRHQSDHKHKPEENTQGLVQLVQALSNSDTSDYQEVSWCAFYQGTIFSLEKTIVNHSSQSKIEVNRNKQQSKQKEIQEYSPNQKTINKIGEEEKINKQLVESEESEMREGNKKRQQNKVDQAQKTEERDQNKQKIDSKTEVEQNKIDSEQKMQRMPNENDSNTKIVPIQKNKTNNKALDDEKQEQIQKLQEKQAEKEQEQKEKELKAESNELKQQVPKEYEIKENNRKVEKDQSQIPKLEKQNGNEEQKQQDQQRLTNNQHHEDKKIATNNENCQKILKITENDKDTYISNKRQSEEDSGNRSSEELIQVVQQNKKMQSQNIKLIKEKVNEQFIRLQEFLLASQLEQNNQNKSYKNINNVEDLAIFKDQSNKKEQITLNGAKNQHRDSKLSKQDRQCIEDQQNETFKDEKEEERVLKESNNQVVKEQKQQLSNMELGYKIQQVQSKSNEVNNKKQLSKDKEQKQLKGKPEEYEQKIKQMQNQELVKKHEANTKVEQTVKENKNKHQQFKNNQCSKHRKEVEHQTDANKHLIQQEINKSQQKERLKQQNRQILSEECQESQVNEQKQGRVDEHQNQENQVSKENNKDVEIEQKEENQKQLHSNNMKIPVHESNQTKQNQQIFKNKQKDVNQQKKLQICDKQTVVQNQQAININKICNDGQDKPLQKKILNPRPDLDLQKYQGNDDQPRQSLKRSSKNSTEKHLLLDKDNIYFQQKRLTQTPEFVISQHEKISVGTQKNDVSDFGLQTGMQCQREVFLSKNNSKIEESLRKDHSIINGYKMSQGESQVTIISVKKTDEDKKYQRKSINKSIERPQAKNDAEINKLKQQKQYENENSFGEEENKRKSELKQQIRAQKQQQPHKLKEEDQKINKTKKEKKVQKKKQKIEKNNNSRKQKNKEQSECEQSQQNLERTQNNHDSNVNQEKFNSQIELKVNSQIASSSSRLTQTNPPNDSNRALLTKYLYGPENQAQINKFENESSIRRHSIRMDNTLINPKAKLKSITKISARWQLFDTKNIKLSQLLNFNQLNNFHKALFIIGSISTQLITRLFQNPCTTSHHPQFGVWLCDHFIWKCYVFDALIPVDNKNQPFYTSFSQQQIWPLILQKALAIYAKGYEKINNLQISKILHLLTGSNVLSYKIRQDPTKNNRLYSSIKKCLQKNYFVYCHKHDYNQQFTSATYQLENIKKANNDEIVVHLKETKDGKENKFWIKSEKFIQEFKSVDIVLLRQNSNNCRLSLKNEKGTFSIVCLDFQEDAQGSITISNKIQSGSIKVFLYREQASNTLKLVGEAKEKDKNQLFFDCSFSTGKYYVFIETQCCQSTISYTGESRPSIYLKQQIKAEGYKNDFTQYLPISKGNKQNSLSSRLKKLESKNESLAKSKKPMSQANIDILKQTFVRFLAATATQQAND